MTFLITGAIIMLVGVIVGYALASSGAEKKTP